MVGLGIWESEIKTMMFRGTGVVTVLDNNGDYDFRFELKGSDDLPEIIVKEITEDGNTLNALATCDLLKGKDIPVSVTFEGESMHGFVKIPFMGKIDFDGKKIG